MRNSEAERGIHGKIPASFRGLVRAGGRERRPRAPRSGEPSSEAAEPFGKYVYCIVETSEPIDLGPIGIGGEGHLVYSVHHRDLAAVVSDTPLVAYDPTRENLLAHEMVNERVMRDHTMIPMSFGTVFRTEADVMELLRITTTAFGEVLGTIRGKVELGLKAMWDREHAVADLEASDPGIRQLKAEITGGSSGSTYFARMRLGRVIEGALEERAQQIVTDIQETLRSVSVARRANKLIGDNMILNAAFLVDRAREEDFDAAVEALSGRYRDLVSFKYTGPWPPYNFVNIRLELERSE